VNAICDISRELAPGEPGRAASSSPSSTIGRGHDCRYGRLPSQIESELGWRASESVTKTGLAIPSSVPRLTPAWWQALREGVSAANASA